MKVQNNQISAYSILLTILVLMIPITSYQEELETIENTELTPVEKIVRIMGTEENSVNPNSIYVRTFDVVTFVNLDGANGGTTHNVQDHRILRRSLYGRDRRDSFARKDCAAAG